MEEKIGSCNSVSEIQRVTNKLLRDSLLDSVSPAKTLLSTITQHLQLKEKFTVDTAVRLEEISDLWAVLRQIDPEFDRQHTDKVSQRLLSPLLKKIISHCCRERHYFFEVKKCGKHNCTMCTPVCLPKEEFDKIKPFPNPMIKDDGHYKSFEEVYGTETSENCRPSKQASPKKLPYTCSVQHVKNSGLMLMCEECGMWRLFYTSRKLSAREKKVVEASLDGLSFACGSQLKDVDLDLAEDLLSVIFVRDLQCNDPVEELYYSADNANICVHCCADLEVNETPKEYYPQCEDCLDKEKTSEKEH